MQPTTNNAALNTFLQHLTTLIITPIVTLLGLAAFTVFVWGVVEYVRGADDAEARKKGQEHIFWGLIGLMIMFGTTAIITVLNSILAGLQLQ